MWLKEARQDLPSGNAYLAWKNLCKKYGWSSEDQDRNENENGKQEDKKGQEKSVYEEKVQVKNRSQEDEAKPIEDKEMPSIEVNMPMPSPEKEEDEKFQVLTDQDETVAPYHEMNEKQGINDVNDDREARNAEAGREERKSDQELVDCCEIQGSTQKSSEERMKNADETNDYGAALICDERHKNFYRTMQNDDATDFDDSFLYTPQLQCEEAIYAKRISEEASLMTENDVRSEIYAVEASKHEKVEKHEFGRDKPAESTETIHKTIKHDATTDFIERTKENDCKLIEIRDFEVYGVNDGAMVFASSEKFF